MKRVLTSLLLAGFLLTVSGNSLHAVKPEQPTEKEIKALINDLCDEHPFVRTKALYNLACMGTKARPFLEKAIKRDDFEAKELAKTALKGCENPVYFLYERMLEIVDGKPDDTTIRCYRGVQIDKRIKALSEDSLRFAMQILESDDLTKGQQEFVTIVFQQLYNNKIEKRLIKALDDGSETRQGITLDILLFAKTIRATKALVEKAKKSSKEEKLYIIDSALRYCGDKSSIAFLKEMSKSKDREVAITALSALSNILYHSRKPDPEIAKAAVKLLDGADDATKILICNIVGDMKAADCCKDLVPLLDDNMTLLAAAEALAECGYTDATDKIVALLRKYKDYYRIKTHLTQCLLMLGVGFKDKKFAQEAKQTLIKAATTEYNDDLKEYRTVQLGQEAGISILNYYGNEATEDFMAMARLAVKKQIAYTGTGALRMMRDAENLAKLREEAIDTDLIPGDVPGVLLLPLIIVADKGALPLVKKHLESKWPMEYGWATVAAYAFGDDSVRDEVIRLSREGDLNFRMWGPQAMTARGEADGIGLIIEGIQDETDRLEIRFLNARLEWITGHSVGYNFLLSREEQKAALKRWMNWWRKNKNKSLEQIRLDAYNSRGYKVKSFKDPASLPELIRALNDDEYQIRFRAGITLAKLLGRAFPGQMAYSAPELVREHAVKEMTKWYESNKDKIKWSKGKKRFVIE